MQFKMNLKLEGSRLSKIKLQQMTTTIDRVLTQIMTLIIQRSLYLLMKMKMKTKISIKEALVKRISKISILFKIQKATMIQITMFIVKVGRVLSNMAHLHQELYCKDLIMEVLQEVIELMGVIQAKIRKEEIV